MIPTLTSSLIAFTDKIDLTKFTDEDLLKMKAPFEDDPLDFLIQEFTRMGNDLENQMIDTRREQELQRLAKKKEEKESGIGESEDVSVSVEEDL